MSVICSACGFHNGDGVRFCGGCGKPTIGDLVHHNSRNARMFQCGVASLALLFVLPVTGALVLGDRTGTPPKAQLTLSTIVVFIWLSWKVYQSLVESIGWSVAYAVIQLDYYLTLQIIVAHVKGLHLGENSVLLWALLLGLLTTVAPLFPILVIRKHLFPRTSTVVQVNTPARPYLKPVPSPGNKTKTVFVSLGIILITIGALSLLGASRSDINQFHILAHAAAYLLGRLSPFIVGILLLLYARRL